jgi:hypothetical protein
MHPVRLFQYAQNVQEFSDLGSIHSFSFSPYWESDSISLCTNHRGAVKESAIPSVTEAGPPLLGQQHRRRRSMTSDIMK